jgi:site-specific DNA-methyltransferase (adenine-specific)
MKPRDGTFAHNALTWGVAGLWVDGGRIGTAKEVPYSPSQHNDVLCHGKYGAEDGTASGFNPNIGRWPANLLLDEEAAAMLDEMSGESGGGNYSGIVTRRRKGHKLNECVGAANSPDNYGDYGGASRFFYCPKASRAERNAGLPEGRANGHPTVKPLSLMRYLVRLTRTPTGGVVLDPFMGSGSTILAAIQEGRDYIGIEMDIESFEIAKRRVAWAHEQRRVSEAEYETQRLL